MTHHKISNRLALVVSLVALASILAWFAVTVIWQPSQNVTDKNASSNAISHVNADSKFVQENQGPLSVVAKKGEMHLRMDYEISPMSLESVNPGL